MWTKVAVTIAMWMMTANTPPVYAEPALTEAEARDEVQSIVERVMRIHPSPFRVTSKDAFYAEVATLLERTGEVTAAEQYFGIARLLSQVSDTHTQLHVTPETPGFDRTFPVRFRLFPDGLYVIAGNDAYRDLIGKRVVSIGGAPRSS